MKTSEWLCNIMSSDPYNCTGLEVFRAFRNRERARKARIERVSAFLRKQAN